MPANEISDSQPVYVYGVVRAGAPVAAEPGVAGKPVELVEHDGVAAVVSAFPADDARVRRRDLLAHLRTLEQIFDGATVAPCPFGTVIGSRRDVEERFLAPRREELTELLTRLDGHVQMNVKAEYDEEGVLRELVAGDRDVALARERAQAMGDAAYYENIRLGEAISGRLATQRATDAEQIAARLSPLAVDAAVDTDSGELVVLKGSFLVRRDGLDAFDAALDELAAAEAGRIGFTAIGPLPPTAFATLEPESGSWA